jgi:hypothetical protein
MGLASIWAFVGPKYQNAPENPAPTVSLSVAPVNPGGVFIRLVYGFRTVPTGL